MKTVSSSSGKVLFIVLIALAVVIGFSAGAGVYFKKIARSSKPAPQPVMTRHKISSTPAQPEDGVFGVKTEISNPATQTAPPVASQVLDEAGPTAGSGDVAQAIPAPQPVSTPVPPEGGGGEVKTKLSNPATQTAPPVASPVAPQVLDEAGPAAGAGDVAQAKPSALDSDGGVEAKALDEQIAVVSTAVESENPKFPAAEASPTAESENPSIPVVDAPTPPLVDEKPSPQLSKPEPSLASEDEIPKSATVDSLSMEETDFFAIQVGAYRSKDNASQKVAELIKKGYEAFIIETRDAGSQPWYTVRFGRYASKSQAQAPLIGYKQTEKASAIIMHSDR